MLDLLGPKSAPDTRFDPKGGLDPPNPGLEIVPEPPELPPKSPLEPLEVAENPGTPAELSPNNPEELAEPPLVPEHGTGQG